MPVGHPVFWMLVAAVAAPLLGQIRLGFKVPVVVCSGTFTMESPPVIPGVFPAQKSPDMQGIWSALEAALPQGGGESEAGGRSRRVVEATVWRD